MILWACFYDVCIIPVYHKFFVLGSIINSVGIVGSSYMMVLAFKWVITCESG
jgi:hypothetical protein